MFFFWGCLMLFNESCMNEPSCTIGEINISYVLIEGEICAFRVRINALFVTGHLKGDFSSFSMLKKKLWCRRTPNLQFQFTLDRTLNQKHA